MKWFTSDCHFGHDAIAKLRGFPSSEEHDAAIIAAINSVACRKDTLYILGDFCWLTPGKYRMRINSKDIRYVIGNHDQLQAMQNTFGQIHTTLKTRVHNEHEIHHTTYLCHFPISYWCDSHNGSWHLYGHTHASREVTLDAAFPGRQAMDVGLDNIKRLYGEYRPISEHEVYAYMSARPGHDHTSFYDEQRASRS